MKTSSIVTDKTITRPIARYKKNERISIIDDVVVEEPLEIRVNDKTLTITMRTPGDDFALTTGFLYAEGIIKQINDIDSIRFCAVKANARSSNIVRVHLKPDIKLESLRLDRHFYASSSCGVCGKSSLEALEIHAAPFAEKRELPEPSVVCSLPERLRESQTLFHRTGGLHAAGLFDKNGVLLASCEDVGRHNAVDKLIGLRMRTQQPIQLSDIMCISGRASFEILQKAIVARVSTIVAVGAPSSLACELAERFNMTLVGFSARDRFNLYAGRALQLPQ